MVAEVEVGLQVAVEARACQEEDPCQVGLEEVSEDHVAHDDPVVHDVLVVQEAAASWVSLVVLLGVAVACQGVLVEVACLEVEAQEASWVGVVVTQAVGAYLDVLVDLEDQVVLKVVVELEESFWLWDQF